MFTELRSPLLAFLSKILLSVDVYPIPIALCLASSRPRIVFFFFNAGFGDVEDETGAGIDLLGFPFTLCLGVSFPKFGAIFLSTTFFSSNEGRLIRELRFFLALMKVPASLCD